MTAEVIGVLPTTRKARMLHLSRRRLGLALAFLAAFLFMLFLMAWLSARTAAAAPLLDSGDSSPQARDAVATLTAQGLIDGYPDGTYKGDRSMTRDEAARLLDSLQSLLQEKDQDLATQEDLQQLEQAVNSLHDSLESRDTEADALQQKVDRLEQQL